MDRDFKRHANIKNTLLIFVMLSVLAIALLYFLPIPTRAGGEKLTSGDITFTDGSGNPLNGKIEINGAGISGNHKEGASYVSWKNLPHVIISYNVLKTLGLSVNLSISKDSPKAKVKLHNYGIHMPAKVNISPPGTPLKYVEISAAGVFFSEADLSIQYTDAEVTGLDVDKLTIYSFDSADSTWTKLPTKIDTTKKLASTKVKSFSVFALSGLKNATIQIRDTHNTPFVSNVKIYDEAKNLKKNVKTNTISPADIPARGELEVDALPGKNVAVKFKLKKVDKGEIILDDFGTKNPVLEPPPEPVIKYVDISANNLGFDSVEVRIHYTDKELGNADENTLVISHWNGVSWEILPTTVDAAKNTVTAITTSLSPFAVYPFTSSLDAWSYAGNSIPEPANTSWLQASSAAKSAVASIDSNRWETKLTTDHNQTDYQMYRFNISEPAGEITNLTSTWIGYGETLTGYDTYLYIWNNSNNSWKQLDTRHLAADGTLNGSITTGITDYVNASGYVYIAAAAKHYNYAPPAPAGLSASAGETDATISWSPATDPDNDTVQYYAEIVGVANSGWISGTGWYYSGLSGGYYYTYRVKTRDTFASAESSFATGSFDTASPPPSCPFLYIWNGTGFEYSTDIAGAVLGARTSVISYPRYYDMPDLKANNGSYDLLVREVLPEADYFDMAKLVAADVPDGYNIYTNWLGMKSFGVGWHDDNVKNIRYAYPTTPQLLTTNKSTERTPIHATNSTGSDVTAQLQKVDNNPLRETAYGMDEYILDFGEINHPEYAKLIISAWINFIPGRDVKQPIILSVINETGQWEQAAELGSFTGDLETQLYNISNIWITEDHRLKLRPSYSKTMTLVIDKVMIDDSKPVDVESTIVNLSNANLRYRGNDKIIHSSFDNRIHGDNVVVPDITSDYFYGNFTKYGDVTPLLTQIDDKYAIMRHGDELSLGFDEVAEVNNKHRQYFLYALDWYVTMTAIDTNRTFIRDTVGLLPFVNMSTFPYNTSIEDYPHDAEHNQYINDWNTRTCEDRVSGTCYNSTTGEQVITGGKPEISENVPEKPMLRSLNTNYVELKLAFNPPYNISGYVTDISSGLPLSGVLVRTNTGLDTTTNASGFYNFSLINSTYTINASKIGYDTNATIITVNGTDLTNANISLVYHPFNLSGYILNKSSGLPLSGVTVKVANTSLSTTTGADGLYNFTMTDGGHSVVAILQNYAINFTTVTVNGANITNANISLITAVSQGRDAWHSAGYNLPLPYSASWIQATLAQKNAILNNDSDIWETKLTTGHDQYDDQLYRFQVMQPGNEVKNLTVKWIGHGENKSGYNTSLYIWNYNGVSWELLDTKNLGVEGTLNRSITINPGNYIDLYGFVYIAARARHYDYVPGTPSWISLYGTIADEPITCSWGPVIDLDGDLVQYFADINGYNSGWINDTSFTNTALYEGNTCSVKTRDNYTYTESSSVSAYTFIDYSLNTNYVELELAFNPGYNVSGYITDVSRGLPINDVLLQTNNSLNTTTNASGFYSFTLLNSTYSINASKMGYDDNATTVTVNGGDLTNVNISLFYLLHDLSGYITDKSSGLPLSGVLVRTNTGLNTTTNASGFYNFTVFDGTYTINASKIGYDDNATTVTVTGDTTNINIPLLYHPYKLSGYIIDKSSGLPLSGVTVKTNAFLNMTTDADGFYNFTLIDGEHSIVAILQNYAINSTTVTINGANISNANISLIPTVSRGRDAWHSAGYNLPVPYSASWVSATLAQKSAILYNDSNIWETKLTTGHDQYDDQLYRFNVMQPGNEVKNLSLKWIGHGENKPGYDAYLYIWNYSDVSWELLDTKNLGVNGTLNRSITINPGNYIDLYGSVYIAARARHYDYVPGTPSWISLDGTYADEPITCSWGPVIDLDGDLVQYFANINGYNSGWINDTSFTGTALYADNTCSVKTRDNYTYTESSLVSANAWMDYYSLNTNYVELKVNNQLIGNNIFSISATTTFSSSSITWNNDVFSDNRVYYGLNETDVNNLVNGNWSVWNNNSINPVIRLTGLMANTTYYFRPLTWYLGTVNNSVKAMALTTVKPGVWVSPAEYMVSPAGWISSPANFRTINISAAPLSGNGRYIPDLSLEAVIYNNSGVEIGRINLTGNGPYYANFNLPDYFTDEGGYVTITNYSMAGEFSVLKWSCVNCHADGERYPSNFSSAAVHSRHINTEHTMSCDSSCHNNDVSNFFVVHSEPNNNMDGCNGNSCHKPVLTCNECHNDVQNSADVSITSVLSDKYGKDVHSNKQCTDCHGNLPSINAKPNCSTCHPRPDSNLTGVPGSIDNRSHSNNQTVACGQCHSREHDVKALTTTANECKNCHTGITHDRGTLCTTCHGSDPHTVSDGSGPGCLDCHNTSSPHRFENDSLSIYYLDGANFSLSVHSNLNSNNASGYGINASCWACHGNGTKPAQHPANYKKPFYCADCHTPSGSQSSKYNAPLVYKHYPGSLFTGSIVYDATDTNRTCVSCHNNSKVITQNLSYGTYDAGKVKNASVSHYSANRTQGEILMESGAVTAALPNTRSTNGTNYGCNQCHSVGGLDGIYGTDYGNARGVPVSHNLMGTTGISCQSACHNSNPAANVTLHDSNVGIYPDGCYTPGCHAPPTGRRGR